MHLVENKFLKNKYIGNKQYKIYCLRETEKIFGYDAKKLPFTYRILLENIIRRKNDLNKEDKEISSLIERKTGNEIFFS